ncbi:hypothetical protein CCACVL1_27759 [Corchorus capsularis]|uniref:Uncharacterized protein n=1 Tax=Corchorus capsularis TaxID=210143 RepID=A0A1R3G8X5_COCAP|nr:hypothetical protein CCACVL1_27759 [Corchorus capsularis]
MAIRKPNNQHKKVQIKDPEANGPI